MSSAIGIVETMYGKNFDKQLWSAPLSDDAVICRMGYDMAAEEELPFCKPIELKATALALLAIYLNCTTSAGFQSGQALKQKSP